MIKTWTYCNFSMTPEAPTVEGVALVLHLSQRWLDLRVTEDVWEFCAGNSEIYCLNCELVANQVTKELVKFRQSTGRRPSNRRLEEFIQGIIDKMAPANYIEVQESLRRRKSN